MDGESLLILPSDNPNLDWPNFCRRHKQNIQKTSFISLINRACLSKMTDPRLVETWTAPTNSKNMSTHPCFLIELFFSYVHSCGHKILG